MTLGKLLNSPLLSFLTCQIVILVVTEIKRCVGSIRHIQLLLLLFATEAELIGWGQSVGGLGYHIKELHFSLWAQRAAGDL